MEAVAPLGTGADSQHQFTAVNHTFSARLYVIRLWTMTMMSSASRWKWSGGSVPRRRMSPASWLGEQKDVDATQPQLGAILPIRSNGCGQTDDPDARKWAARCVSPMQAVFEGEIACRGPRGRRTQQLTVRRETFSPRMTQP